VISSYHIKSAPEETDPRVGAVKAGIEASKQIS
jgi:hypothetical protein